MDESKRWTEFGQWLTERRDELGLKRRDVARRAKVSEQSWRELEAGRREAVGGIKLLPNPTGEVLERVAQALEVPFEELLRHSGRPRGAARPAPGADAKAHGDRATLAQKISRLTRRDRHILEVLVDAMLAED